MSKRISLTAHAHSIILQYLTEGDFAIDATVGNGHDTLFLARQVGIKGKVFGFDIQQQAIEATQTKLETEDNAENTRLFFHSHNRMDQCIPIEYQGHIKVIMFNLGYLPGSDKSIITQTDSTLAALKHSLNLLAKSGIITIAAYPGHTGGMAETNAVDQWLKQLPPQHSVQSLYSSDTESAPRLYIVKKTN